MLQRLRRYHQIHFEQSSRNQQIKLCFNNGAQLTVALLRDARFVGWKSLKLDAGVYRSQSMTLIFILYLDFLIYIYIYNKIMDYLGIGQRIRTVVWIRRS